jgi:rod shape-determining protein MreB
MSTPLMHRSRAAGLREPSHSAAPVARPFVAIDVGSASIRVAPMGEAVIEEPSVVATAGEEVVAAGWPAWEEAKARTKEVALVHPVCGGAPVRRDHYTELIRQVGDRALRGRSPRTVAISVPLWMGSFEWAEVLACLRAALPSDDVIPVSVPTAAALGTQLVPPDGQPQLVIDVGHHLVEAAVLVDGVPIASTSAWTGGADAKATLAGHLLGEHGLDPGPRSLGRALRLASHPSYGNVAVRGVDTTSGQGRVVLLHSDEVAEVLTAVFDLVADTGRRALDATSASVASAALINGVLLTGGMARVHGLRERIADAVATEVTVVDAPSQSVVRGMHRLRASPGAMA